MCWNLLTSTGKSTSKYLYAGDTVGPGKQICLFIISLSQSDLRGLNVCCVPLGFYGIDLRQHPQAPLIRLLDWMMFLRDLWKASKFTLHLL